MPQTDWLSSFRDSPDNILYVTPANGGVLALNNGEFSGGADFMPEVFGGGSLFPLQRRGNYVIQGTLGGTDPISSADCAWEHATHGDWDNQLWNGSTTDPDDTSGPVCRDIGSGSIEHIAGSLFARSILDYSPAGFFTAPQMAAEVSTPAAPIWLDVVRQNLDLRGVLSFAVADPIADGVPADIVDSGDYDFEWEPGGVLELVAAYIQGDTEGGAQSWTDEQRPIFVLNDTVLPAWDGTEFGTWSKGYLGDAADLVFTHDGSLDYDAWIDLGFTAWPGKTPFDDEPDVMVGWTTNAAYTRTAPTPDVDYIPASYPALKVVLRSPRYRWVWDGPETSVTPPRRILARPHPARIPGDPTYQNGSRSLGGIL